MKVSVIVPNYNHAPYLKQRIDSILNQTYTDFELIILDDCSTDNSREVIESYRDHPKVATIVYNEKNSGSTFKQWAKGFAIAKGNYIWIAESDDWAEPSFLQELVQILQSNPSSALVFSNSYIEKDDSRDIVDQNTYQDIIYHGCSFIKEKMIIGNAIVNASSVLFKKKFISCITSDYQIYKTAGDKLFWIMICECGDVIYVSKPLNHFRKHQNEVSEIALTSGSVFKEELMIYRWIKHRPYISIQNRNNCVKYYISCIDYYCAKNKSLHDELLAEWNKEQINKFLLKLYVNLKSLKKIFTK